MCGRRLPAEASHSAVFAQIDRRATPTDLARGANMTPQAMGELVDELEGLGYVVRRPDPTDRRAKLIVLTERGQECIAAGLATIDGLEQRITEVLGERGRSSCAAAREAAGRGEADDRAGRPI